MCLHNFLWSSLDRRFYASQIISVTNFVVVSSAGMKGVDCIPNLQTSLGSGIKDTENSEYFL